MNLNNEQQELFELGVELYELHERQELNDTPPFFAEVRKQLYKSFVALVISLDISNEEEVARFEGIKDYEELLNTFPKDHPSREYYKGILNLTPTVKACVTCDFKITMVHFFRLLNEAIQSNQANMVSGNNE
ncbi:hypothetical protein [Bacillus cereus]|uniref:hypothetical protein n=1 Tax=Bacillus cereus TaxID=1396 RepID=UPI000BFA7DEF|nr:hypothetical protein [Bacillus cereus]MDA2101368.1 hypothetical protein [Bacillus cereus]MDA2106977.1 hypothetical protein [Bacillus cereus]PFC34418.1 hypothetical protein CN310_27715 [Bacillus cereus]PFC57255.1 hypothetical protein CN267_27075 [Bacillus cereus]